MLFGVVYDLANGPTTPAFRAAARQETPETEKAILDQIAKPAERLGVGWIEDAAVAGGVLVSSVAAGLAGRPGRPARGRSHRAVRRPEDSAATTISSRAVAEAASPAALPVKRPGEKKPLDVTVTLAGSPLRWGMTWRVDDAEPGTVILTHVVRGSPAARAGLAAGDRIYQVGGRDFADEAAFVRLTKTLAESLQLLVERDGRLRTVTLRFRQAEPLKRAA